MGLHQWRSPSAWATKRQWHISHRATESTAVETTASTGPFDADAELEIMLKTEGFFRCPKDIQPLTDQAVDAPAPVEEVQETQPKPKRALDKRIRMQARLEMKVAEKASLEEAYQVAEAERHAASGVIFKIYGRDTYMY